MKGGAKTKALDERRRLLFAKIVVKDQHFIGAVVAVRSFEVLIKRLADEWGIQRYDVSMGKLVKIVGGNRKAKEWGYSAEAFREWWDQRIKLVHDEDPISRNEAKRFVDHVVGLANKLHAEGLDLE